MFFVWFERLTTRSELVRSFHDVQLRLGHVLFLCICKKEVLNIDRGDIGNQFLGEFH